MRKLASEIIRNLEKRIARLERTSSKEIDLKSSISLNERVLQRQLDDIVYQGKKIVDQYEDWVQEIENDEIYTGMDIDLMDANGFDCQIQEVRSDYLGYNQDKDLFVIGFDLEIYSHEAEEAYEKHLESSSEYEEALEQWENLDEEEQDMVDMPEEDDYPGIDYMLSYPKTEDASAYAVIQVQRGNVLVRDVEFVGEKLFDDIHAEVKRKYKLVDLFRG
jgi:hypothetical protein